jgi:zinc protease
VGASARNTVTFCEKWALKSGRLELQRSSVSLFTSGKQTARLFAGALFDQVRSKEGLAYSVSADWDAPATHPGLFVAYAETARPADAIRAIEGVLTNLTREPLPEEVIEKRRQQYLNTFVFRFTSKAAQLHRMVMYDMLGLPRDYLQKYQEGVQRVTAQDTLAAARRHLHPEKLTIVVVADAKAARPQLEALSMPVLEYSAQADEPLASAGRSA